jgi:putative tricarboxylic transport membrane protein
LKGHELNRDRVSSGLFFLLGLLICLYSLTYDLGSPVAPGSGLMPFLCGAAMCFLAVTGFTYTTLRKQRGETGSPLFQGQAWQKSVLTLGALLALQFLMKPLGFILATFLFISFLLRAIVPQRWPVVIGVALLTAALSFLLFEIWLQAQLPRGPWGI